LIYGWFYKSGLPVVGAVLFTGLVYRDMAEHSDDGGAGRFFAKNG
jgi:hypothetical protein